MKIISQHAYFSYDIDYTYFIGEIQGATFECYLLCMITFQKHTIHDTKTNCINPPYTVCSCKDTQTSFNANLHNAKSIKSMDYKFQWLCTTLSTGIYYCHIGVSI